MKRSIDSKNIHGYLFGILGILFIVFLWSFASIVVNNDYIIPSVSQTISSLILFSS